jgi:hypothetical protein
MNFSRCRVALLGFVVLVISSALGSNLLGDDDGFRLTRVDGSALESSSVSIDSQGRVTGAFEGGSLPIDELVLVESIGAASVDSPDNAGGPRLYFVTGGSIGLTAPTLMEGQLAFQSTSQLGNVPLESVRAIVWESSDVVNQLIENPSVDNDAVVVRQGDQLRGVEGVVEGLTDQHVTLRFKGKSRKIGLGKVAAIVMANLQLEMPNDRVAVNVVLARGGSIKGRLNRWMEGQIFLAVGGDSEIVVPEASIARMTIDNDRLVYLSDLEPVSVQQRAMFTTERPWRRDLSVEGNLLTIYDPQQRKKITFNKGIGTHSWSSLVFANERSLDRFTATVGIDSETMGRGDCRMIVRGDGIELWSGRVTGMSGPQAVDVSIRGIDNVELEVVPGEEFDLADHANWCDARFIKSKQ